MKLQGACAGARVGGGGLTWACTGARPGAEVGDRGEGRGVEANAGGMGVSGRRDRGKSRATGARGKGKDSEIRVSRLREGTKWLPYGNHEIPGHKNFWAV